MLLPGFKQVLNDLKPVYRKKDTEITSFTEHVSLNDHTVNDDIFIRKTGEGG